MDNKDIAMDFFNGLDNVRYVATETLNSLTAGTISQPENLNAMHFVGKTVG